MKSNCIKMAYDVIRVDKSLKAKILRKAEKLSESKAFWGKIKVTSQIKLKK